jgi:tetratricopeptide (TPR) repeat protein
MRSQQGFNQAIALLDRAIVLAPTYAEALGYAAAYRAFRPLHNCGSDPARDFREADDLGQRALEADPSDSVALRSASFVAVLTRRDFKSAFDLIGRSLAMDQNGTLTWGAADGSTFGSAIRTTPLRIATRHCALALLINGSVCIP